METLIVKTRSSLSNTLLAQSCITLCLDIILSREGLRMIVLVTLIVLLREHDCTSNFYSIAKGTSCFHNLMHGASLIHSVGTCFTRKMQLRALAHHT